MMEVNHQPQKLKSVRLAVFQYFAEKASHVTANGKVCLSIAFLYYKKKITKKADSTSQKIQHFRIESSCSFGLAFFISHMVLLVFNSLSFTTQE